MERRRFNSLCTALLAGAASSARLTAAMESVPYPQSKLVYDDESPVTLASLEAGKAFIFSYPYVTTPCFLMRLDKPAQARGDWPGGIDTDQTVVAFSAICSHKMSHPAKPISHIAYRPKAVTFYDKSGQKQEQQGVISCCSERSVYDPSTGGKVLSGPAPVPLAAITLQADNNGQIIATGSVGPDQYDRFLEKFGFRLAMEHGVTDVRTRSHNISIATPAELYSKQQVLC